MKAIKISVILYCIMLLPLSGVFAQVVDGTNLWLEKLRMNKSISEIGQASYSNIAGDPYIFKDFHKGQVKLKTGESYQLDMRFDIYAGEVHFKYKNEIFALTHAENMTSIMIDTLRFVYTGYLKSPGGEPSGAGSYFLLQTDGKCKLLIKKNIRIQDPELAKPFQDAKPATFIQTSDTYFLKLKDESAVRIRSENDLRSVLVDQKTQLTQFIKSNKLGVKSVEDLSRIVTYYNGL